MQTVETRIGFAALAIAGCALTFGCGTGGGTLGGGGGGTSGGTISAAVTDTASDDIESFVVDVKTLRLNRIDGAVVNVISAPVTLDLATLTDTTQLLNLVNVPVGVYDSATITLDFTNASCVLIGQNNPAAILDPSGIGVTGLLTLPVQFGAAPLDVLLGKHRLLELDFDLNQSVSVNSGVNTVTLEPAFVLHIDGSGKKLATAGGLVSVDASGLAFVGNVKTLQGSILGNVDYTATSTTVFQVDGVPATGTAGLTLLDAKPNGTWIQVYGEIDPDSPAVKALYVEAGTGTYNGFKDIVEGHVIDRVGNPSAGSNVQLKVLGRSNNASHTTLQYNKTFTVTTSFASTKVVRRFSAQAFDLDDVNVGQRVRIYGSLNGTSMTANQANDVIRVQVSRLFGFASGPLVGNALTLSLQHVDLRSQSVFTWLNSGGTAPVPSAFTADVGTLGNGLGILNATPVEVRGFLAAVNDDNQDFTAETLINLDAAPSLLFVRNQPGGFAVNLTTAPGQILIGITGLAGPAEKAIIDHGFAGFAPLPTVPTPTIVPSVGGGLFMLRDKGTGMVHAYFTFAAFSTALNNVLTAGAEVVTVGATGTYTALTNTIQATLVSVIVN